MASSRGKNLVLICSRASKYIIVSRTKEKYKIQNNLIIIQQCSIHERGNRNENVH